MLSQHKEVDEAVMGKLHKLNTKFMDRKQVKKLDLIERKNSLIKEANKFEAQLSEWEGGSKCIPLLEDVRRTSLSKSIPKMRSPHRQGGAGPDRFGHFKSALKSLD